MDDHNGQLPATPLTLASLRAIRERKTQLLRDSPVPSSGSSANTEIKAEDVAELKHVVKRGEDASTSVNDLHGYTVEARDDHPAQWLSLAQYPLSEDEAKASQSLECGHASYASNNNQPVPAGATGGVDVLRDVNGTQKKNYKPGSSVEGWEVHAAAFQLLGLLEPETLQTTFGDNFRAFHGPACVDTHTTCCANGSIDMVAEDRVRFLSATSTASSNSEGQLPLLRTRRPKTLSLSEYLKRKHMDINEDLRGLHGLTMSSKLPNVTGQEQTLDKLAVLSLDARAIPRAQIRLDHLKSATANPISFEAVTFMENIKQAPKVTEGESPILSSAASKEWNRMIEQAVFKVMAQNLDLIMDKVQQQKRQQTPPEDEGNTISEENIHSSPNATKRRKLNESEYKAKPAVTVHEMTSQEAVLPTATNSPRHKPLAHGTKDHPSLGSSLRVLSDAVRWETGREGLKTPASFSIKALHNNSHLDVDATVVDVAFRSIFKYLKAAVLLGHDVTTLRNSHKGGKCRCLFALVSNEVSQWPKEGQDGQFACKTCLRQRRTCIVVVEGDMFVLPLPQSLREGVIAKHRAFCILSGTLKSPKGSFFK
jgi:hypothetical protein